MSDLKAAAQQTLEAWDGGDTEWFKRAYTVMEALRAALAESVLNPAPGYCKHCKQYTIEEPLPAEPVQEPVAWSYELATTMLEHGYDGWEHRITRYKPNVPEGSIRNLTPLYAAPPQRPAEPIEPVAWTYEWKHRLHGGSLNVSRARWPESDLWIETPLYAAPPQRKPLTEEEIDNIWDSEKAFADIYAIVRAIERAHGIKEEMA